MKGSYGTVGEWSRSARTPTYASIERIAAALETRARRLLPLAERMRTATSQTVRETLRNERGRY